MVPLRVSGQDQKSIRHYKIEQYALCVVSRRLTGMSKGRGKVVADNVSLHREPLPGYTTTWMHRQD